jgi:hypothetical protein
MKPTGRWPGANSLTALRVDTCGIHFPRLMSGVRLRSAGRPGTLRASNRRRPDGRSLWNSYEQAPARSSPMTSVLL